MERFHGIGKSDSAPDPFSGQYITGPSRSDLSFAHLTAGLGTGDALERDVHLPPSALPAIGLMPSSRLRCYSWRAGPLAKTIHAPETHTA